MSTTSLLLLLVAVCSTTTLAQFTAGPSIPTLSTCTNGQIWVQNYIQFQCQVSGTSRAVVPIACVPSNTTNGTTIAPGTTYDDTNFRYTCNQTSASTMAYYAVACFDGDRRLFQVGQMSNSSNGYTYSCYLSGSQVQLSKTLFLYGCTSSTGQRYNLQQAWIQDDIYQMVCSASNSTGVYTVAAVQIACIYSSATNQTVPLNRIVVLETGPIKCAYNGSMYVLRNLTTAELLQFNSGNGGNTQVIGSGGSGSGSNSTTAGSSIPTLDTCTNGQIWVQNYIQFQCQVSGTSRAVIPIACVPSNTASGTTIAPGTTYDDTNFRYTCNQTSANTMAYYIVACFDGDHRLFQVGQSSNSSDGYTYKCYLSGNQIQLSKTLLSYDCTSLTGQKYALYQTWIQDDIYQMVCSATNSTGVYTVTAAQTACIYSSATNQTVPLNRIVVLETGPIKCAYNGSMYVLRNLTTAELQQFNSTNGGSTQVIGSGGGFGNGSNLIVPQPTTTSSSTTTTPPPPPPTTTTPARTAAPTTVTTTTAPPPPLTTTTVAKTAAPTVATAAPTTTKAAPTTTTAAPTTTTAAPTIAPAVPTTTTAAPTTTTTAAPATEQVKSSTPPPSTTTAIIIQPTTTTTQPPIPSTKATTTSAPVQSGNNNCTDSFLFCSQLSPVCLGRSFKIFENVRQLLRSGNVSSQELVQAFDAAVQKSFSDEVSTTTTESSLAAGARLLVRAFAGSNSREEEGERGQVAGGCKCARRQGSACDCAPPAPPAPGCERCRRFKTRLLQLVRAFCPLTCHACDAGLGNALPDLVQQLVQLYLTDCQSSDTASTELPPPDANRLLL